MAKLGEIAKGWPLVVLASLAVVIGALHYAQEVLIPVVLAVLFSYLLAPIASRVERLGLGRVFSVLFVVGLALAVVLLLAWIMKNQFVQVGDRLPGYRQEINNKVAAIRHTRGGLGRAFMNIFRTVQEVSHGPATQPASAPATMNSSQPVVIPAVPTATQPGQFSLAQVSPQNPMPVRLYPQNEAAVQTVTEILTQLLHPLLTTGLIIVFVIFMLLSREDLRDRIVYLVSQGGRMNFTTQIMQEGTRRISHYLVAQSMINGLYGLAVAVGLEIIGRTLGGAKGGFPNVLLWGLLSGLLRFVPYVGVWIAAAFPILLAFGIFPGNAVFLATLLMFVGLELLVSQFVEPLLYGSVTGISTIAILVAAVFWTSVWGPIGLLLSTPLTVVLAVVGKYVPQLEFLNILLSDEPVMELPERIYQRLIALDPEEALELAHEYRKSNSLEQLYDEVFIPVLVMAELDHHRGMLDESRRHAVLQGVRDMVEEIGDQDDVRAPAPGTESAARTAQAVAVVCLPAHEEAEEIACLMLAQLLVKDKYPAFTASAEALIGEKAALVEEHQARIACISALPPNPVARVRPLGKWLHDKHPDVKIIAGLWGLKADPTRVKERLAVVDQDAIVTSLRQARAQIDRLARGVFLQATKQ